MEDRIGAVLVGIAEGVARQVEDDEFGQRLEVLHLLELPQPVVADVDLHQRRQLGERAQARHVIVFEGELRQVGERLQPFDARDLILAQIESREHGEAAQVFELDHSVVLERQLLEQDALLQPLDARQLVVAKRRAPQRRQPLEVVQLAQVLVVQIELLDACPPVLVRSLRGCAAAVGPVRGVGVAAALAAALGKVRDETAVRGRVRTDQLGSDRGGKLGHGVVRLASIDCDPIQHAQRGQPPDDVRPVGLHLADGVRAERELLEVRHALAQHAHVLDPVDEVVVELQHPQRTQVANAFDPLDEVESQLERL
mmetsp:Transcript_44600/g.123701  ORF Transcript_44600/g.123701 Transcript_44600/m.123701 type:complete len:312 (-) Transcript_44600:913-1848(-)